MGLVGHDIHVVATRILTIGMVENGFRPYDIGTNNGVDDFVDAVVETGARAVLVASVNGEGEQSCSDFGTRFAERGLTATTLAVGGNLVVGDRPSDEVERLYSSYGFHRVFHRPRSLRIVFDALRHDVGHAAAV